jgi:hypothetical protein
VLVLPSLLRGHGEKPLSPGPDGRVDSGVQHDKHDQRNDAAHQQHRNHGYLKIKADKISSLLLCHQGLGLWLL